MKDIAFFAAVFFGSVGLCCVVAAWALRQLERRGERQSPYDWWMWRQ